MDILNEVSQLSDEQAAVLEALLADEEFVGSAPARASEIPRAVPLREGAGSPLFIVHGSGGRVLFLHPMLRYLSPSQSVYGVEAAGRDGEGDVCARYVRAICAVQPRGPYRIGGYSAGCLIAFQAAAQLLRMGEPVEFLLLIDPAPVPDPGGTAPKTSRHKLHRRIEMAALAGVTPLSPEFPGIMRVNRELADVARTFDAIPIDLRIHLVRGTDGAFVTSPAAVQGWKNLAGRGLACAEVDTDHFGIMRDPKVAETARHIQGWLEGLV